MPAHISRKRKREERTAKEEPPVKYRVRSKTGDSRKPEPVDFTKLFNALQRKDAVAADRESRLFNQRCQLEANQQEHEQLLERRKELKAELARSRISEKRLLAAGKTFTCAIEADKQTLNLEREEIAGLRFWGAEVVLTDLPHELLPGVFQYLGYVHQQRLTRVCRLWKHSITSEVDSIYVDAMMLFAFRINSRGLIVRDNAKGVRSASDRLRSDLAKGPVQPPELQCDWKYRCHGVRSLIFDGMYLIEIYPIASSIVAFAGRFPSLSAVNLIRYKLDCLGMPQVEQLQVFADAHLSVRLTVSQSVRTALRGTRMVQGRLFDTYVEVPDTTVSPGRKIDTNFKLLDDGDAIWPYPPIQIEWLAQYAGYFNKNKRVMNLLRHAMAVCEEHDLFCQHLDISFYRDKLRHRDRNLLALNILLAGIPDMEPPPVPFRFKRLGVIAGRLRLLPEF